LSSMQSGMRERGEGTCHGAPLGQPPFSKREEKKKNAQRILRHCRGGKEGGKMFIYAEKGRSHPQSTFDRRRGKRKRKERNPSFQTPAGGKPQVAWWGGKMHPEMFRRGGKKKKVGWHCKHKKKQTYTSSCKTFASPGREKQIAPKKVLMGAVCPLWMKGERIYCSIGQTAAWKGVRQRKGGGGKKGCHIHLWDLTAVRNFQLIGSSEKGRR